MPTSTVAPQALTLLNSQEVLDRAIAFASRLLAEKHSSDEDTIRRAFRLSFGRVPSDVELTACVEHWREASREEASRTYEPVAYPERITRTVMAEKTGEPYSFIEVMPAYATYQPDAGPTDVDARTRGLAHVCRVLLNTNEFSYLD